MKSTFVGDISDGDALDTHFAVASRGPPRPYNNGKPGLWFSMDLSDKTGSIQAVYWGRDEAETRSILASFGAGDVVRVRGMATKHRERLQISINEGNGLVMKIDDYNREDLIPVSPVDVDEVKSRLLQRVRSVTNPQIRSLLESLFGDAPFLDKYAGWPAAKSYHHGYAGGLIQHSLNMVELALAVSRNYAGDLDTDMLVAGCLLHDVGKMRQYDMGVSIGYTTDGDYLGHISMGVMMVQECISRIRESGGLFDSETERHLVHIILSHHGEMEHGSPVVPCTPEAMVVHKVDACDAQVKHMLEQKARNSAF